MESVLPDTKPSNVYLDVAVDIGYFYKHAFTYKASGITPCVGDLVCVPFKNARHYGIVLDTFYKPSSRLEGYQIREIIFRVDGGPFVDATRMQLGHWIADTYRCSLFTAISPSLPPGFVPRLRIILNLVIKIDSQEYNKLTPQAKRAVQIANKAGGTILKSTLIRKLGYYGDTIVSSLIRRGNIFIQSYYLPPPVYTVSSKKVMSLRVDISSALSKLEVARVRSDKSVYRALLYYLEQNPNTKTASDLSSQFSVSAVQWSRSNALIDEKTIQVESNSVKLYGIQQGMPNTPNREQSIAIDSINRAIVSTGGKFVLFGITGSGKTEIYLHVLKKCIESGKRALVLVPEIELTQQFHNRILSRFPEKVGLYHGRLTRSERYSEWTRIQNGKRDIVLGTRSALFTPIQNLGLVILDEEHEWAYEQQEHPKYSARAVAEELCNITNATLVLGSATPDVGSFRRTKTGELTLLSLSKRVWSEQPIVKVVDMRSELKDGHTSILSRELLHRMNNSLDNGGRVMLFINRRGYTPFIQCIQCGRLRLCPKCEVTLTYHAIGNPGRLICHYCNYSIGYTRSVCVHCKGKEVSKRGIGTQLLEEVVKQEFPNAGVIRWDSDTAHPDMWERILEGKERIIVGTQMIAKGHHLPSVTCAAAIAADIGLSLPDFRASERTFQLITQLVGRSGRGTLVGNGVVQTFTPEHYAIVCGAYQDYYTFYEHEIALRARSGFPPFNNMIRIIYGHRDYVTARDEAKAYAQLISQIRIQTGNTQVIVRGPSPTWPPRISGKYCFQIYLLGVKPLDFISNLVDIRNGWIVEPVPF